MPAVAVDVAPVRIGRSSAGRDERDHGHQLDQSGVLSDQGRGLQSAPPVVLAADLQRFNLTRLQCLVDEIRAGWAGKGADAPFIVLLDSMSDPRTPPAARAADRRQREAGSKTAARGFIEADTVYLVGSALATRSEALETVAHESIGHWGLKRFFGDRLDECLDELCVKNRSQVLAKASAYGLDGAEPAHLRQAAEEVLAELASDGAHPGLSARLEVTVRGLLRTLVPSMRDEPYSRNELISKFIAPVRARLSLATSLVSPASSAAPSVTTLNAARARFDKWFGLSKVVDATGAPKVVFHGTHASFDTFEPNDRGLFFGEDPTLAASHANVRKGAPNVMPVFLSIKNPWQVIKYGDDVPYSTMVDQTTKTLKAKGYDGVHDPSRGVWIAFEGSQVKSAIGNNGDFDRSVDDIRFDRGGPLIDAPIYHSELHVQLRHAPTRNLPAGWLGYLGSMSTKGISPEEVEWSGLVPWLQVQAEQAPKAPVTRDQVLDRLETYGVRIDDVVLEDADALTKALAAALAGTGFTVSVNEEASGAYGPFEFHDSISEDAVVPPDELPTEVATRIDAVLAERCLAGDRVGKSQSHIPKPTRYAEHSLVGGSNYRELLLTLGRRATTTRHIEDSIFVKGTHVVTVNGIVHQFPGRTQADAFVSAIPTTPSYKSPHWMQNNVLVHIRLNERTDAQQRRVLFVEEIQSDWAQEGRRVGFHADGLVVVDSVRQTRPDRWGAFSAAGRLLHEIAYPDVKTEEDARRTFDALVYAGVVKHETKPKAPFVMRTTSWVALALRRVLKLAADEGFASVAFVTGEQNAVRGRQDKRIGNVKAMRLQGGVDGGFAGASPAEIEAEEIVIEVRDPFGKLVYTGVHADAALPVIIGDDLAEKVSKATADPGKVREFMGLDVRVRGEGMRTFYDKIVPNVLRDVLHRLGCADPSTVAAMREIRVGGRPEDLAGLVESGQETLPLSGQLTVEITPDIRAKLSSSIPMFCRADESDLLGHLQTIWNDLSGAERAGLMVRQPGTEQTARCGPLWAGEDEIDDGSDTDTIRPRMGAGA